MYLSRVSSEATTKSENGIGLGPKSLVGQCAFQKLLKISVAKRKDDQMCSHIRSFGELSELEHITLSDGESEFMDEEPVVMKHKLTVLDEDRSTSTIETMMLALWEMCQQKGLFRYDVTACATKTLPGSYGFQSQLNEGRATKKRPTEFRLDQVVQDFDEAKFNFTKAFMQEILFQFDTDAPEGTDIDENASAGRSPDVVIINVSPIEYGHVLLVPRVLDRITQIVDASTMNLALQFTSAVGNPYFRLGYNSLGAFATINHLHFQGYFLNAPYPVELAPTVPIVSSALNNPFVRVSKLVGYPVRGWVFEMSDTFDQSLQHVASAVGHVCQKLQAMNVPHNLLICDCGARVFLWPQCYAEKQSKGLVPEKLLAVGVNPAAFEIAGHIILKNRGDFDEMTQAEVWNLLSEVSLSPKSFLELTQACLQV